MPGKLFSKRIFNPDREHEKDIGNYNMRRGGSLVRR